MQTTSHPKAPDTFFFACRRHPYSCWLSSLALFFGRPTKFVSPVIDIHGIIGGLACNMVKLSAATGRSLPYDEQHLSQVWAGGVASQMMNYITFVGNFIEENDPPPFQHYRYLEPLEAPPQIPSTQLCPSAADPTIGKKQRCRNMKVIGCWRNSKSTVTG